MLINDPAAFCLLIPTYNGAPLLARTLDYLSQTGFRGHVAISDSSVAEHRDFTNQVKERYPRLSITLLLYPESVPVLDKLTETLRSLSARYVMLHANDDFVLHDALEPCVQLLEKQTEYSTARGRFINFEMVRHAGPGNSIVVKPEVSPYSQREYEQADAADRVVALLERYSSTFYSVHRRTNLIENLAYTGKHAKNAMFIQYLSSAIAAIQGKIHCSDELFYVRQYHAKSLSNKLSSDGNESWPRLIVSPDFSRYYQDFREALRTLAAERAGIDPEAFGERIDAASVSLFRRSFCESESIDPREAQFRQRMTRTDSPEYASAIRIMEFARNYPDTH